MDRVWLDELGERPIKAIRYSELMTLIGNLAVAGKTLNNYLIPLRGVFEFARRDCALDTNPAAGVENAPVQKPAPDPFTLPEVAAILDNLTEREDIQVVNYFAAAFFAGFRPSEQIALRWSDVDFQQRTVRVQRAVVRGQAKASTKTYLVRDVELSDRAWGAIEAQRAHTQLVGKEIFGNPATGEAWADIQSQWRIWQRCLKRLGLRYREPYQTRHTFATSRSWPARILPTSHGSSATPTRTCSFARIRSGSMARINRANATSSTSNLATIWPRN